MRGWKCLVLLTGFAALTPGITLAERESDQSPPTVASVIYVSTPHDVVAKMLELAKVEQSDLVYDLGCGDGRIVVAAAKTAGSRAVGFEINPALVEESRRNVEKAQVGHLVEINQKDIFSLDLSEASVVMLYLDPGVIGELIPQLQRLKPGSRIVSHDYEIRGMKPDGVVRMVSKEDGIEHHLFLWTAPLNAK